MKKSFLFAGIATILLNVAQAQQPALNSKKVSNPTADSITSKYSLLPMPAKMSMEQAFPVVGVYQSTTAADQKISVTLDEQNKGLAWIDGLPQGRVKAILKKSPAVYKIPAQKTTEGKDVLEGTLIYDKDSRVINIVIGRSFNDAEPSLSFSPVVTEQPATVVVTKSKSAKTKEKVKPIQPWVFTGTKLDQVTASN
jgi:hypothetical protein